MKNKKIKLILLLLAFLTPISYAKADITHTLMAQALGDMTGGIIAGSLLLIGTGIGITYCLIKCGEKIYKNRQKHPIKKIKKTRKTLFSKICNRSPSTPVLTHT